MIFSTWKKGIWKWVIREMEQWMTWRTRAGNNPLWFLTMWEQGAHYENKRLPKEKEVLFLIAHNSVVELIAMVCSGAKSTNRCWKSLVQLI